MRTDSRLARLRYFVYAVFALLLFSYPAFAVDVTPPTDPGFVNDGTGGDITYVNSATTLSANWGASSDPESGVAKYWYEIGTAPGLGDIVAFTDNGLSTSVTKTGLALLEGTIYYFTVKAENGVALQSNEVSSNGQKVDTTPPAVTLTQASTTTASNVITPDGDTIDDGMVYTITGADLNGVKDWQLGIYDYNTDCTTIERLYSGVGVPPPSITWEGKNNSGKVVHDVDIGVRGYCYRYYVTDNAGNQNSVICAPASALCLGVDSKPALSGNATATAWHQSHKIVRDSSNRIHMVYASGGDIMYTYSTDEGQNWTDPSNISATPDDSDYPALAMTSAGQLRAVWQENVGGTNKEIFGVGIPTGSVNPFQGGTPSNLSNNPGNSEFPSIAIDSSGVLHVVWRDDSAGFATGVNPDIAYSKSTDDGATWSAPLNLSSNAGTSSGAGIASGSSGRLYVTWWDDSPGNDDIFFRRYNGSSWDGPVNVSNNAATSVEPAVVADSSGNVHVVWQDDTGGDNDIYYKMYNGTSWDAFPTDVSGNVSDSVEPNIAVDTSNGDVLATWEDNLPGNYDIYYKKKGSYGWNAFVYNLSNSPAAESHYVSPNVNAGTAGVDTIWTDKSGAPYDIKYGKADTIVPIVNSLSSPTHSSQTTWYGNNTPRWDFTGSDNVGGVGMYGSYRLISSNATETISTVRSTGTYQITAVVNYTSGALGDGIWYFHLIYEDNAGNLSTVSDYQTRVDASPPAALATPNDGTAADTDIWYFPTYFSGNWTATTDAQSGVSKYWYAIYQMAGACVDGFGPCGEIDDTSILLSTTGAPHNCASTADDVCYYDNGLSTSVTKSGLSLTNGVTYYFRIKAQNAAGLQTAAVVSDGAVYTVDITPPTNIANVYDGTSSNVSTLYTGSTTQLSSNWTASSDPETGVAKYWYAIYKVTGTCADGIGACGETDDTSVLLSTSGVSHYCASTGDDVCYVDNSTAAIVTKTGLTLTNGSEYYFRAKAQNGIGLQSNVTRSIGAIVDTVVPTDIASAYDGDSVGLDTDLAQLATAGKLSANWTASTDSPGSGICRYWVAIGTSPGGTTITNGWDDVGNVLSTTRAGLMLAHGVTYYVSIQPEDCVGYKSSGIKTTNGQKADLQGPTISSLASSTHPSMSTWYNNALPTWSWAAADGTGESGLKSCYYLLDQTASPSANTVKTTGTVTGAPGSFTQGAPLADGVWYFHLVCEDTFNNLSGVENYTTRVDTSAPAAIANVYDGDGADISTTTLTQELSANWTASADGQSGIAKYWYAIYHKIGCIDGVSGCTETDDVAIVSFFDNGTAQNVTDTTVNLTSGQNYYFAVKAENGSGLQSAVAKSNGVDVNNNGPTIITLTSSTHPVSATWYSNNTPAFAWTAQDNGGSGIQKYYYTLDAQTTRSQTYMQSLTTTTTLTNYTYGAQGDGTWYFHLMAKDNNNFVSSVNNYTVKIDTGAPTTIASVYDGATTTDITYSSSTSSLTANWTSATDARSGVAKYLYSIYQKVGTCVDGYTGCAESNDTLVTGPIDNGTGLSAAKTGLTLTDGAVYAFSVKAQDVAGNNGTAKSSNGVTIDSTAPSAPSFVYDGTGADASFTSSLDTLSANWATSSDAQTGIAKYYYAIYKENGACIDGGSCAETDDTSVVAFTSAGTSQSVTKTGLTLSASGTYYFAVKAENGAGGQSSVANSNGIVVDVTAPLFSSLTSSTHPSQSTFYNVTLPSLSWAAADNTGGSGISKYYYLLNQNASETAANVKTTGTQAAPTTTTFTQGTALADGTYYFNLVADDAMGNLSTLSSYALNIDTGYPALSSIGAVSLTGSATITWTTNEAADSTVEYGTTTAYGSSKSDATLATSHSVNITGLTGGLTYHYRVKSKDGAGNLSTSSDNTFITESDTTAPSLTSASSTTHPDSTKWINNAKPSITWAATDDKGVAGAYILFDQTQTQTAATIKSTGAFTATSPYTLSSNLSQDGIWYAHVVAADNGANLSGVIDVKLLVDTSAPSTTGAVVNDGTGADSDFTNSTNVISATWSPFTDSQSGVKTYYFAIGTTSGGTDMMSFTDIGNVTTYTKTGLLLTAGKTYYVSVKAENNSNPSALQTPLKGLESAVVTSNGITVDTTAPKALSASSSDETTVVVVFDEGMDRTTAETASNYKISPALTITKGVLSSDKKSVTLTTSSQSIGKSYTVTISGVKDLAGNVLSSANSTATFKGRKTITFAAGKTLMSLPMIPDSANPSVFFGTSSFTMKSYDPSSSTVKAYPDPFVPGLEIQKGYMLVLTNPLTINVTGTAVARDASSPYRTINLKAGWNVIGNPFDESISFNSLKIQKGSEIKSIEDADDSWWAGAFLWTYYDGSYKLVHATVPGALRTVEPWRGYLVFAVQDCALMFPASGTAKAKEEDVPPPGGLLWSVQIAAQTAKAKDDFNFAGVSKIAPKLLVSEPPNIEDDYVSVYFDEGGRKLTSFYKDSRSKEESLTFTVETSAKSGEAVDLSFAFTGKTEGLDVTLTDLSSLKQVALEKEGKYSYAADGAPHSFKLDVKDKAKEEAKNRPLNITQLLNYPNPDRVGNTTFKYAVDGNVASVTIEVYTMTGKLIDKIAGELDGDTVWKFGDSLPNGVYVYRLVVTDVNGSKVSKINKLVVLK